MNILVIEEQLIVAMEVNQTLKKEGHTVDYTSNIKTYQKLLSPRLYDLVIIEDTQLKKSDIKRFCNVPIIVTTGNENKLDQEMMQQFNLFATITKPFNSDKIVNLLKALHLEKMASDLKCK